MAGQGEQDGGHEPVFGQFDRRTEHRAQWESPVPTVEGQPAVDRAGHGDAADVAAEGHDRMALGPHPRRVDARTGTADGQQGLGFGSRPR